MDPPREIFCVCMKIKGSKSTIAKTDELLLIPWSLSSSDQQHFSFLFLITIISASQRNSQKFYPGMMHYINAFEIFRLKSVKQLTEISKALPFDAEVTLSLV